MLRILTGPRYGSLCLAARRAEPGMLRLLGVGVEQASHRGLCQIAKDEVHTRKAKSNRGHKVGIVGNQVVVDDIRAKSRNQDKGVDNDRLRKH